MISADINIESVRQRVITEMPFTKGSRGVARTLDLMSPRPNVRIENIHAGNVRQLALLRLAPRIGAHIVDLMPGSVLPGKQARPSRRTIGRSRISIRKDEALLGKTV